MEQSYNTSCCGRFSREPKRVRSCPWEREIDIKRLKFNSWPERSVCSKKSNFFSLNSVLLPSLFTILMTSIRTATNRWLRKFLKSIPDRYQTDTSRFLNLTYAEERSSYNYRLYSKYGTRTTTRTVWGTRETHEGQEEIISLWITGTEWRSRILLVVQFFLQ